MQAFKNNKDNNPLNFFNKKIKFRKLELMTLNQNIIFLVSLNCELCHEFESKSQS